MAKYSKNGGFVTPIEDEGSDEVQEIHLRDQILEVISEKEPHACLYINTVKFAYTYNGV